MTVRGDILILIFISVVCAEQVLLGGIFDLSNSNNAAQSFLYAIEEINDSGFIPNVTLVAEYHDAGCQVNRGLQAFLALQGRNVSLAGIIGPTCSSVAGILAGFQYRNIPFISHSASSPVLSDIETYPTFFRVINSDVQQARAWLDMLIYYDIRDVAILYSSEDVHFQLANEFSEIANATGINVHTRIFPGSREHDMRDDILDLKSTGINTIFLVAYKDDARRAAKIARDLKMNEFGYMWIGSDSWGYDAFADGDLDVQNAIQGFIVTTPFSSRGVLYDAWLEDFQATMNPTSDAYNQAALVYDAVYTYATAFKNLIDSGVVYEDSPEFLTLLSEEIFDVSFVGLSGQISFTGEGDREQVGYKLLNYQGSSFVEIGTYNEDDGFVLNGTPVLFPGNYTSPYGELPLPVILIGSLIPWSGGWDKGYRMSPAFDMAIYDINSRSDILPNFILKGDHRDSQCEGKVALAEFLEMYQSSGERMVAVVGAGCSIASQPLAQVTPAYGISTVSYASTSPVLSDKSSYPLFARTVAPDTYLGKAWYGFIKEMGWNRVSTMSSNEDLYSLLTREFLGLAEDDEEIQVLTSVVFPGGTENLDVTVQLNNIKDTGGRIIMLAGYSADMRTILDTASDLGMTGELGYFWLLSDGIWTLTEGTDEKFLNQWEGICGFQPALGEGDINDDFWERIPQFGYPDEPKYSWTEAVYDATFVIAHALHRMLELQHVEFRTTYQFKYDLAQTILNSTDFEGVNGRIRIDENGDRVMRYRMLNLQDGVMEQVGIIDELSYEVLQNIIWTTGARQDANGYNAPSDFVTPIVEPVNIYLGITMMTIAGLGISLCIFFMIVVGVLHDDPVFTAARVTFCIIILISGIIGYSSVFLLYFPTDVTCLILPYSVHLPLILIISCILAKAYRVWKIFIKNLKRMKRIKITDFQLLSVVGALFVVVLIYLIICTLANPYVVTIIEDTSDPSINYAICTLRDNTGILSLWPILIYIFEGVLVIIGVYFAYQTRKVELLYFNESSYIALTVYNLLLTTAIIFPVTFLLKPQEQNPMYGLFGFGVLVNSSAIVGFLFISRLIFIYKRRDDDTPSSTNIKKISTTETGNSKSRKSNHKTRIQ